MTADQFYAIRSAVHSLTDCTAKTIEAGQIRCRLAGMCSSLVSHRTVEFDWMPAVDTHQSAVTIRSSGRILRLCPTNYDLPLPDDGEGDFVKECVAGAVPTALLRPLIDLVAEFTGVTWPAFPVLLWAATLRHVKVWDDCAQAMVPVRRLPDTLAEEAGDDD